MKFLGAILTVIVLLTVGLLVESMGLSQRDPNNVGPVRYGDFNVTGAETIGVSPPTSTKSAKFFIDGSNNLQITRGVTNALSVSSSGGVSIVESIGNGNVPHACTKRISAVQNSAGATVAICNAGEINVGGGCFLSSGSASLISTVPATTTTWTCEFTGSVTWTAQGICCIY